MNDGANLAYVEARTVLEVRAFIRANLRMDRGALLLGILARWPTITAAELDAALNSGTRRRLVMPGQEAAE